MINITCLSLCIKYPHSGYIGGAIVNSTHYIGVEDSISLTKNQIDAIALALITEHRNTLDGVTDDTILTYYVNSFSHVSKVKTFVDFADTKKALYVNGVCYPYIHAQEPGRKEESDV